MVLENKLMYWRATRGLKLQELADKAGVNIRTVINIENGNKAYASTLGKLARVLDVDVIEFTELIADPKPEPATVEANAGSGNVGLVVIAASPTPVF